MGKGSSLLTENSFIVHPLCFSLHFPHPSPILRHVTTRWASLSGDILIAYDVMNGCVNTIMLILWSRIRPWLVLPSSIQSMNMTIKKKLRWGKSPFWLREVGVGGGLGDYNIFSLTRILTIIIGLSRLAKVDKKKTKISEQIQRKKNISNIMPGI